MNVASENDASSSYSNIYQKPAQQGARECALCTGPFGAGESLVKTAEDELWHLKCFVCHQCLRPFDRTLEFYERYGRKYCRRDFITLFAPCCARCHAHIAAGRFIRAMNQCWHPDCFLCEECDIPLCDMGFVKSRLRRDHSNGNQLSQPEERALCHGCHNGLKTAGAAKQHTCHKCRAFIEENEGPPLKYENETYHAYHFNCRTCGVELRPDARQVRGELYCLRCHDKMDIRICGACRRPIEERAVTALGKHFHVDHFVCCQCEKPFLGKRHYEVRGLAYCQRDYYQLFGRPCYECNTVIEGGMIRALGSSWCEEHFACAFCQNRLTEKSEFYDVESRPCCRKCYKKLPSAYRKGLYEEHKRQRKLQRQQEKQHRKQNTPV